MIGSRRVIRYLTVEKSGGDGNIQYRERKYKEPESLEEAADKLADETVDFVAEEVELGRKKMNRLDQIAHEVDYETKNS